MESIGEERTCQLTAQYPKYLTSLNICSCCIACTIVGMGGGGEELVVTGEWRRRGDTLADFTADCYRIHNPPFSLFTTGTGKYNKTIKLQNKIYSRKP